MKIEDVINDMKAMASKWDAIGAGFQAIPIHTWIGMLEQYLLEQNPPAPITEQKIDDWHLPIVGSDTCLTIKGESRWFRCIADDCGANVFSKTRDPNYYVCNGCNSGYNVGKGP
ncbi:hypothetical protein [Xanthomonas phage BUDD]|nr:hypothetical protein [Xanthomonas phage BUDD]